MADKESKSDKFHRLANARVADIVDRFRVLSNLAGPNYAYTADEIEAVRTELQGALDAALGEFKV